MKILFKEFLCVPNYRITHLWTDKDDPNNRTHSELALILNFVIFIYQCVSVR